MRQKRLIDNRYYIRKEFVIDISAFREFDLNYVYSKELHPLQLHRSKIIETEPF